MVTEWTDPTYSMTVSRLIRFDVDESTFSQAPLILTPTTHVNKKTFTAALAESADGNKNKSTSPPIIYNFKQKIVPLKDGQENVGERIVSLAEPTMARIRCEITL